MLDLHSSQIAFDAEISYRRRLAVSLRHTPQARSAPRMSLRASFAEALAHIALHLDMRSIDTVAARHHPSPGTRYPKGGAA